MTTEEMMYRSVKVAPTADAVHYIQWGFGLSVVFVLTIMALALAVRFRD